MAQRTALAKALVARSALSAQCSESLARRPLRTFLLPHSSSSMPPAPYIKDPFDPSRFDFDESESAPGKVSSIHDVYTCG